MSLRAMLWALNEAPTEDPTEAFVLVALADNARDDGRGAWPSHATLAKRARCSVSTVQRALRRMEDAGVIVRGDQQTVAHLRADRRPVVYDLPVTAGQIDRPVSGPPTAGQTITHDRSPVTDEPSTNQGRTGRGAVQTALTERARPDGPTPRPLSPQAQATLTRRAEQQAARERGAAAAARRRQEATT